VSDDFYTNSPEAQWQADDVAESCQDDRVGWYEFITADDSATTHVAYVYEDGSVYLPEGPDVVDETDFVMASASNRFWRLVRADEVERLAETVEALQGELADLRPKLDIATGGMGAWMERAKEVEAELAEAQMEFADALIERDALSAQRDELRDLVRRAFPAVATLRDQYTRCEVRDGMDVWLAETAAALGKQDAR
jgi:uncharacterized protein (UPF0216 family)